MNNKILAMFLKGLTLFLLVFVVVFLVAVEPGLVDFLFTKFWHIPSLVLPYEWGVRLVGVLAMIALLLFWKISDRIGKNNSFCQANAKSLQQIGVLAILDTALVLLGFCALLIQGIHFQILWMITLLIVAIGLLISVAAFTLAYLVKIAESIQEENDLVV